jgi:hypothetical protein
MWWNETNVTRIKAMKRFNEAFQKNRSVWAKVDDGVHLPWFEERFKISLGELFGKSPTDLKSDYDLGQFLSLFMQIEFYNTEHPTTLELDTESNVWEKLHAKYKSHNDDKAWSKHPELLMRGRPKKECSHSVNGPSSKPTVGLWKKVS